MLSGNKTCLRAIEKEDLPKLMEWRNNPEMRKHFRETAELSSLNQDEWFQIISKKNTIHKMFAIIKKDTGELMGACGLCYIDWVNRSADFSIYLGYNDLYIDDVYAVDAASLMAKYGFSVLNLHRLWAEIYSIDEKKKKFFNRLGFNQDGNFRNTYWYQDRWHNSLFYSLLSTDTAYETIRDNYNV